MLQAYLAINKCNKARFKEFRRNAKNQAECTVNNYSIQNPIKFYKAPPNGYAAPVWI